MSKRLLLADDDEVFARVLGESLRRKLYEVTIVHTPEEIDAAIGSDQFDYILLDLMMGDISTLPRIRDILSAQPAARLLVLTGYASVATTVQAIKLGATDYLAKPVGTREVLAALEDSSPDEGEEDVEHMPLRQVEWEHIQRVLAEHQGNISATARALGIHRRSLQRKLAKKPRSTKISE